MPPTLRSAKLRPNAADSETPPRTPRTPDIARMRETASKRFLTHDTRPTAKRTMTLNEPIAPRRFTIDLSLPPEQRYLEVCAEYKDALRGLRFVFDEIVGTIVKFLPNAVIHWICWILLRGVWSAEETAEIRGISDATGVEMYLLVCFNVLLDLLMGCSSGGAVVSDPRSQDGGKKMVHFRTLDWGMPALRHILVQLDYKLEPEGEIIASTINYVGFVGTLTGVRKDLSLSLNFRRVHNDMEGLGSNLRYYSHHLLVFLGLRRSITSILRSYMVPRSPRGGRTSTPEAQVAQLPHYVDIVRQVSCVDRPLTTSACYLCFSDGNTTTVFEKDLRTAVGRSSDDFLVITNVDVPDDGSDPISPKTNPEFAQHFTEDAYEAKDRRQCAEHNWRNLRLNKAQGMSEDDFAMGKTEVQVHVEDIIELVQKYPTTNDSTHFACVMDAKEGEIAWCRRWKNVVGENWIRNHMSEGWDEPY